jgi:hypothetical protein
MLAFLFLLTSAPVCLAQRGAEKSPPQRSHEEIEREMLERFEAAYGMKPADVLAGGRPVPLKLPKGDGAWVIQVFTSGGLAGRGKGDLTVSSRGALTLTQAGAECAQALAPDSLQTLAQAVMSAQTKSFEAAPSGVCHDCYMTVMLLQRREAGGRTRTYRFSWDDVTAAKVPADVMLIYRTAAALASEPQQ